MPERQPIEPWRLFWAKTDYKGQLGYGPEWSYPLWAHLIDVANVAWMLWPQLSQEMRKSFSGGVGLKEEEARNLLSLLVGLHDIGKAIPQFQVQHEASANELENTSLKCHQAHTKVRHEHASIAILSKWLSMQPTNDDPISLVEFIGFHHGRLCTRSYWEDLVQARKRTSALSDTNWQAQQQALVTAVVKAWGCPELSQLHIGEEYPSWLLALAGWTTFSDWIGSMAEFFDPNLPSQLQEDRPDFIKAYIEQSRHQANAAIKRRGLHLRAALHVDDNEEDFLRIFRKPTEGFNEARELQRELATLPMQKGIPSLTIVEAPTGEGKSEAAFFLAARQQRHYASGGGIYVAMPTQATSDGLFERFRAFLLPDPDGENEGAHDTTEGDHLVNLHLVHGSALFHPEMEVMRINMQEFAQLGQDEAEAEVQARAVDWFQPRKRGLLAPYAVGTVDQAFLGVLYARHFFLRLYGLAGKTIIFDEVHAYDTYMSRLFVRLLQWLRHLRCHVILLSATLPEQTRVSFLRAWGITETEMPHTLSAYPAIWHATDKGALPVHFSSSQKQHAKLQWHDHQPDAVMQTVINKVRAPQDGTVAVICNTVARTQAIFEAIRQHPDVQAGHLLDLEGKDLVLYHARFPQHRRQAIDEHVRQRFGKSRPDRPGVLVATQVAEQSLDLDFDVMLSDIAPIDLLLQRAGRLQRHQQRKRPASFENNPVLRVLCPPLENGLPMVSKIGGGKKKVYDKLTLWKTWHVMNERIERSCGWSLPTDYRPLIEAVYHDLETMPDNLEESAWSQWEKAVNDFREEHIEAIRKAEEEQLIPPPTNLGAILEGRRPELAEEDERKAEERARALTRLGPPTIEVLCLYRHGNIIRLGKKADDEELTFDLEKIHGDPGAAHKLKLEDEDLKRLRALVMQAVRFQDRNNFRTLVNDATSVEAVAWGYVVKKNPVLRRYHLMIFEQKHEGWIWSRSGCPCYVEDNDNLGLRIHYPKRS